VAAESDLAWPRRRPLSFRSVTARFSTQQSPDSASNCDPGNRPDTSIDLPVTELQPSGHPGLLAQQDRA